MNELDRFQAVWARETGKTLALLQALPRDAYDFRPDAKGRSLGELAWHLAEGDAYMTFGIDRGSFEFGAKPPNIERPRQVEALAPGFQRVHDDAVARVKKLGAADLDRTLKFFDGSVAQVRDILWDFVLMHGIHHRGQLSLMCRIAGGRPPGLFGPTREEMPPPRA